MSVIALIGNKGGSGKTTLAVNMATLLSEGDAIAVIDADPLKSALYWRSCDNNGNRPNVLEATLDLESVIVKSAARYEHVFIDCPPSMQSPQTSAALEICDIALIPVQPSPFDLWSTVSIDKSIEHAKKVNSELRAMLVINQLEPRKRLSKVIRRGLSEIDLSAAETTVRRREIYRTSALEGKSVSQMGRRGVTASQEIKDLINEVMGV